MKKYCEMSREELLDLKKELDRKFDEIKAEGLALDMSRGKPAPDQLDLSMKMMEVLAGDADLKCETGVDCRNYGVIDGIPALASGLYPFIILFPKTTEYHSPF